MFRLFARVNYFGRQSACGLFLFFCLAPSAGIAVANINWNIQGTNPQNSVPGRVVLTQEVANHTGSMWDPCKIDLSQNFDILFDINFGDKACGADGMAFVLQNAPG